MPFTHMHAEELVIHNFSITDKISCLLDHLLDHRNPPPGVSGRQFFRRPRPASSRGSPGLGRNSIYRRTYEPSFPLAYAHNLASSLVPRRCDLTVIGMPA